MNRVLPRVLTVGLVAGVAVLGSIAGRAVWESVIAEDQPKAEPPPVDLVTREEAQPRFQGEVQGIFIGPPEAQVPDKFLTHEETCGGAPTEQVGWEKAGEFALQVQLPQPFVLDEQSLNTGVIACGDKVYAARWDYKAKQLSGYTGSVVIARGLFKYEQLDVSVDRVEATEIGGLPAVLIKPLTPTGIGSAAGVIFPGESVTTSISSTGVPEVDLMTVAEMVAAEIKRGR